MSFTTPKTVGGTPSRNNAGQFVQEEKTLDESLMVKIHDEVIGNIEVVATDYNALMAAKCCLAHLAEHAGQTLSLWKATLAGCATDLPPLARN